MSPQQTIAHYRIIAKLGEGGMGEVWRATDTKLNREVAIKVLPVAFAADPDRMARFQREAQVLASLNHHNIAAIYGVEERALVMELVEGPTLAERIAEGPVPLAEALDIAHQIGDALEAAHEKGVVHRDLKPANIKIAPDGRIKVLDFGLAKAMAGDPISGDPVDSPTLTMKATVAGVILGTAAYMAPEQAKGKPVDRRADIWAFGVVLYEMLTGHTLFTGETISDTLAAVLTREPDAERVPAQVRKLLRSCLEKDPKKRLRDIGDAWRLLEEAAGQAPANPRRARPLAWIAAAVFALTAAGLAFVHFRETAIPASVVRFTVTPPDKGAFSQWLALSPDGRHLAFSATSQDGINHIWIRSLDSLEVRQVPGSDATGVTTFFWSADSRFLVFQGGAKLRKMDVVGGVPYSLCDSPVTMLGGSWNAAGDVLFGSNSGPISRVSSAGGISSPLTRLELSRNENYHSDPVFLPDGVHFLYFRHSSKSEYQGLYVGSLESKPEGQSLKRIQPLELSFGFAPPRGGSMGQLLVVREGSLFSLPFDVRNMETSGEPVPVADQIGSTITRALFSVSANGVLVYRGGGAASDEVVWFDRQGRVLGAAANAGDYGDYEDLALSPDGTRLAYNRPTQGPIHQIWILDIARDVRNRLTFIPEGARAPVWSPDGRRLAFSGATTSDIYIQDVAAGGSAEHIFQTPANTILNDWTHDGRFLVYTQSTNAFDVFALSNPMGGGERKALAVANSEFAELHGRVSPDGRWVAYDSTESGRAEIYVRPFPPGDGRTGKAQVSSNGGQQARWRADGGELYYIGLDRSLMAVDVKTEPSFQSGTPHALFATSALTLSPQGLSSTYDVTQDGNKFIAITLGRTAATAPATVVLNWDAAVKR